uniref:Uncharacterized protein n=1 Tax=Anguilla anguilla TaxID=7936 RepID=A0A0E9XR96_ANGAN
MRVLKCCGSCNSVCCIFV